MAVYAGAGIRTRDNGDAPSDQPDEDYEPRTLTRLSYPGPYRKRVSGFYLSLTWAIYASGGFSGFLSVNG